MAIVSNASTVAFLEDLNTKLKRFDEMLTEAREDITKAVARLNAQREALELVESSTVVVEEYP